jgi:hypothetical protein
MLLFGVEMNIDDGLTVSEVTNDVILLFYFIYAKYSCIHMIFCINDLTHRPNDTLLLKYLEHNGSSSIDQNILINDSSTHLTGGGNYYDTYMFFKRNYKKLKLNKMQ